MNILKNVIFVFLIGVVGIVNAESIDGNATATVVSPITITESRQMDFGSFSVGSVGGNIILDEFGVVTPDPDINYISGGTFAASYDITGEPNTSISVSVSGGAILSDGTNIIPLTPSVEVSPPTVIDAVGNAVLNIGGTISVSPNQQKGVYNTTNSGGIPYTVTVNYN